VTIGKRAKIPGYMLLAVVAPAAAADQWIGPGGGAARTVDALLAAEPLGPKENLKAVTLARSEESVHLLVQVREREPLHYHADSDISVLLLRGAGEMHLGEEKYKVKAGDVMLVPRGTVHYFVNAGPEPAAALVIYSPPPGPNDRVLVPPAR
jgi:mannose-6-phosphate isomerase-like protein (cupin superfamily)